MTYLAFLGADVSAFMPFILLSLLSHIVYIYTVLFEQINDDDGRFVAMASSSRAYEISRYSGTPVLLCTGPTTCCSPIALDDMLFGHVSLGLYRLLPRNVLGACNRN